LSEKPTHKRKSIIEEKIKPNRWYYDIRTQTLRKNTTNKILINPKWREVDAL